MFLVGYLFIYGSSLSPSPSFFLPLFFFSQLVCYKRELSCLGCAVLLSLGSCAFTVSYIDATYMYIVHVRVYNIHVHWWLFVVRFGHWVCGESWHAIKDSLTHRPNSQGRAPGILPFFCVSVLFVSCVYLVGGWGWRVTSGVLCFLYSLASMLLFIVHVLYTVEPP